MHRLELSFSKDYVSGDCGQVQPRSILEAAERLRLEQRQQLAHAPRGWRENCAMKAQEHTQAMLEWWRSAGVERADLAVHRPDGVMIWHRSRPLLSLPLAWARAENVRSAEVYVRAARGEA